MSIEKITEKILGDARESAEQVTKQAQQQADGILESAKKKAEKILADAKKQGEADRAKQLTSRQAVAAIDGKNLALGQQQVMIEECFQDAVKGITSMDMESYLDFLQGCIKATGCTQGEIVLNKEDRESLGSELLSRAKEAGGDFVLSEETKDIAGGLMIRVGKMYHNASIDAIVEEIHDDIVGEVAMLLFPDREN